MTALVRDMYFNSISRIWRLISRGWSQTARLAESDGDAFGELISEGEWTFADALAGGQ